MTFLKAATATTSSWQAPATTFLNGGGGDGDPLNGGDILNGGDGDDMMLAGTEPDQMDGGAGNDTVSYATGGAVGINLGTGVVSGAAAGDVLVNIENIIASSKDDILVGDGKNNTFTGGAGADQIVGQGGLDTSDYSTSAAGEVAMGSWRNFLATRIAYDRLKSRLQGIAAEAQRIRLPEPYGQISLNHVSYFAPATKAHVIDNVSFRLTPGEALAVIGPSASGKSTLCRLIAGIAAPSGGEIRLDGSELHHWNPEQLGRYVGYLPQDVELFSGSIRDNISRMARADDDEVVEAAMLAHAHEMIQRLPQGYETPIGDAGARLSGGQRQRIGLARAVFGNPKIIILDEPNANFDQSGETALAAAVRALKERGAALMIVGHRPSTLAQADKILFLREGRVELFGAREMSSADFSWRR
ncbi:ATP-binding cassette domain-containing protein [Sinorhizobium prairiense]|uniref:ATP-binding cassette domain-containing protein n=1 Tax=unclassified Sinorhizobium TaxID=2613772 RepID=UPI0023D86F6A|nr:MULTISPECIES: ATP-binding cassette domain-containing protein [unclassified Sinorhizobium]WEJ08644.1 ATP-binding cassette domain-containing protein [Sinorhizobium sp. M103]WEJ13856.1 ATP-binding cassette domain-containing protein [Sinorhizobium sp. K101]WEJ35451.1 ATP-binding cassette domain-containing protein [Sinorhizobium sp. C101]